MLARPGTEDAVSAYDDHRDRETRAAQNQTLFREINERVKELNEGFSLLSPVGEWICECANDTCTELIEMTAAEYEAIRSDGARFFVATDDEHVWPDIEQVTEHGERYWVVEKTGHAGSVARSHDPRSDEGPLPLRT
jgi:hypothetical protein